MARGYLVPQYRDLFLHGCQIVLLHEIMKKALPESIAIPDAIPFSRSINHFSQVLHLRKQVKLFPPARTLVKH